MYSLLTELGVHKAQVAANQADAKAQWFNLGMKNLTEDVQRYKTPWVFFQPTTCCLFWLQYDEERRGLWQVQKAHDALIHNMFRCFSAADNIAQKYLTSVFPSTLMTLSWCITGLWKLHMNCEVRLKSETPNIHCCMWMSEEWQKEDVLFPANFINSWYTDPGTEQMLDYFKQRITCIVKLGDQNVM